MKQCTAGIICIVATMLAFTPLSVRADTTYKVILKSYSQSYVSAINGGGGMVYADAANPAAWETFTLTVLNDWILQDGDQVRLQAKNGNYLCADSNDVVNANRPNASTWETWRVVKVWGSPGGVVNMGDGIALTAYTNTHMVADYNTTNAPLRYDRTNIGGWETFYVTFVNVYDRYAATAYAQQWWNGSNPAYGPRFPADCTNFVSQCLFAGGWKMQEVGSKKDPSAWYFVQHTKYINNLSYTWAGALNLYEYMLQSDRATLVGQSAQLDPTAENLLDVGDVVQVGYPRTGYAPDHTFIVVGKASDGHIIMAAHVTNINTRTCKEVFSDPSNKGVVLYYWKLRDCYVN